MAIKQQVRQVNRVDRRRFLATGASVLSGIAALALSGCGNRSPIEPTPPSTGNNPTPNQPQVPATPQSKYGTYYTGGFAGITGTLEEVLVAARLNPEVNKLGLLVKLNGRSAPLNGSAAARPENGAYFIHVRGQFVGQSAREVRLSPSDSWDLFDWNGTNP